MLKYINQMNSVHWLLVAVAVFALMSVGKLVAVVMIIVAVIAVLVRYTREIRVMFDKMFNVD